MQFLYFLEGYEKKYAKCTDGDENKWRKQWRHLSWPWEVTKQVKQRIIPVCCNGGSRRQFWWSTMAFFIFRYWMASELYVEVETGNMLLSGAWRRIPIRFPFWGGKCYFQVFWGVTTPDPPPDLPVLCDGGWYLIGLVKPLIGIWRVFLAVGNG